MTKQHFIALADAIRQGATSEEQPCPRCGLSLQHAGWQDWQIYTLADFCQSQNPNFNRQRWLDYIAGKCGQNGGAIK